MNYQLIARKIKDYRDWYKSLTPEEKSSWLGKWILERIDWYVQAIDHDYKQLKAA